MRTLYYKVIGQRLRPVGDHTGLVAGTRGYLKACFAFESDWNSYKKVASFYNASGKEYAVPLNVDGTCDIPAEALTDSTFEVKVWGQLGITTISTNPVRERQSGGDK